MAAAPRSTTYKPRDFSRCLELPGFSSEGVETHLGLYKGYVEAVNHLNQRIPREDDQATVAELRRRWGWEFNGMRLHESFFEALSVDPGPLDEHEGLETTLSDHFGSAQAWEEDLRNLALTRGIGWAALVQDAADGRTWNVWFEEHAGGIPAGCRVLLVLDLFEHAYFPDHGSDRASYLDVLWPRIDWAVVADRLADRPP